MTEDLRQPPNDIPAERIVLGGMMMSAEIISAVQEILVPEDFWRPAHQIIYHALIVQHAQGGPTDVPAMASVLHDQMRQTGGPLYLFGLLEDVPSAVQAPWYARQVRRQAVKRQLTEIGSRISQLGYSEDGEPAELTARAQLELDAVQRSIEPSVRSMRVDDFANMELPYAEVLIPGMLRATDRVVVVAPEGHGKSTLARQIWMMAGCGLHPLTHSPMDTGPVRTLYIDLENPPAHVQRQARFLMGLAGDRLDPDRVRIWSKPGGIDLLTPRDAAELDALIADARPQIICCGPLYKTMSDTGERAERMHGQLARYWDQIRQRHGCALWLEAHAPISKLASTGARDFRPTGSGIWSRWPEVGLALLPSSDARHPTGSLIVDSFRNDREDRVWPTLLTRSKDGSWPWSATYPTGFYTP